jgi:DNA polymerase-3 subunit beta
MKITCKTAELASVLTKVVRAVPTASSLPALAATLLEAGKEFLSVRATNLDVGIALDLPAQVEEEGALLLPTRLLADLVKKLPGEETTIKSEGTSAAVTSGVTRATVHGLDPESFPVAPKPKSDAFVLSAAALRYAAHVVTPAASREPGVFSGVYFDPGEEEVALVATDTHRLAVSTIKGRLPESFIIPASALSELARLLPSGGEENVQVSVGSGHVFFACTGLYFWVTKISGRFPEWRRVIPSNPSALVRAQAGSLISAAERAALMVSETRKVPITVLKVNGCLSLASLDCEAGDLLEEVPAEAEGEETEVKLNADYLLDALKTVGISTNRICLEVYGPKQPVLVKTGHQGCLHLILPIS